MGRKHKRQSVTQSMMAEVVANLGDIRHDLTRKQYIRDSKRYIAWVRQTHPECRTLEACKPHIQEYADSLQARGLSPSTIHTYLACICAAYKGEVRLKDIRKPKRYTSEYTRGRTAPLCPAKRDNIHHEAWSRLVAFQARVGLRREELRRLRAEDWEHRDGHLYVVVKRGKGGRKQWQLVFEDADLIQSYFEATPPGERVFPENLFRGQQLNLHSLRAQYAKRVYFLLEERVRKDPTYAQTLEKEIRTHWVRTNINPKTGRPKRLPDNLIHGQYVLRGKNRTLAIEKGLPWKLDKTVLLYVSMFCLAHYRNSVTVASYYLA